MNHQPKKARRWFMLDPGYSAGVRHELSILRISSRIGTGASARVPSEQLGSSRKARRDQGAHVSTFVVEHCEVGFVVAIEIRDDKIGRSNPRAIREG